MTMDFKPTDNSGHGFTKLFFNVYIRKKKKKRIDLVEV